MKNFSVSLVACLFMVACSSEQPQQEEPQELTVYTHRHYEADQQLFAAFEEAHNVKLNVVNASADELMNKMQTEGELCPADVLITVDAGRLQRAKDQQLLQPINNDAINNIVPAFLRDAEGHWFGLTKRARLIAFNAENTTLPEGLDIEDLSGPAWQGKVLIRSSANIYNQSLLASLIVHHGRDSALSWAKGMVQNMARAPKGNDRDQMKALFAGEGEIAVVNSYYLGKLVNSKDSLEAAVGKAMSLYFPNQNNRGTHINISGIGVAKYAPNRELAEKFIEHLLSKESQELFSSANYEYPVNAAAQVDSLLQTWGTFSEDNVSIASLGANNKEAVLVFDEAQWK